MGLKPSLELNLTDFFRNLVEQMNVRGLGVFVGKKYVDVVELRRTLAGPIVARFVSIPIATEGSQLSTFRGALAGEESEVRHDQIVTAIRRALRESGIRSRWVVSNLPEEEVIVRYFQMSALPKKEWDQAIRFEARKYIPFTLEDLVSDFFISEEKAEKGKMNVVFVAAKRQVVERHIALLTKASLQISHLEILPFSFMRLLQQLGQMPKEKTVGIADVDGASCTITLLKNRLPYLVRHVSLETTTEQMQGEDPPLPSESASSELDPLLEKLLDEVRLTLRYYRNQFPTEEIERLLLFGDHMKVGIEENFSKELKLPVHIETLSAFVQTEGVVPSRLARTIGMALRGMTPSGSKIDLLPRHIEGPRQNRLFKVCALEAVGAAICLAALSFVMGTQVTMQQRALEKTKENRVQSRYSQLSKEDLKVKQGEFQSKFGRYRKLLDNRLPWTKKLSVMGSILPSGAWITEIDLFDSVDGGRRMGLEGLAYASDKQEELEIPSQFLAALKQNPEMFEGFQEANLVSIRREVWEGIPVTGFEIVLTGQSKRR